MDCWFSIKTVHSPNPAMCHMCHVRQEDCTCPSPLFWLKQIDLCPAQAILSQEIEKAVSMHG